MLDDFRSTGLVWDKANARFLEEVHVNASDQNGRKLVVHVLEKGQVADLTGVNLSLYWESDGMQYKGLDNFTPIDAPNGLFELYYTTGMLSNVGKLNAWLRLQDTTGVTVSKSFTITVSRGINENAVESENSFTALTVAIETLNRYQSDIDEIKQDIIAEGEVVISTNQTKFDNLHSEKEATLQALEDDFSSRAETLETTYSPRLTGLEESNTNITEKLNSNVYFHEVASSYHHDEQSNTEYQLVLVKHTDEDGNVIPMQRSVTTGVTAREFASEKASTLVLNASTYNMDENIVDGISIENGIIKSELPRNQHNYVLAFDNSNNMKVFPPSASAQSILNEGYTEALTAFIPLIESGVKTGSNLYSMHHMPGKHPRQVISQMPNKDIVILTCGGRGIGGEGMTADDVYRIISAQGVQLAYMLDGGGSTQTVLRGKMLNQPIDDGGYTERAVPDFLHFTKSVPIKRDQDIVDSNTDVGALNKKITDLKVLIENTETKMDSFGTFLKNTPDAGNVNTLGESGIYWAGGGDIGVPSSSNSWIILHVRHSANHAMQIAFPYNALPGVAPKIRRTKVDGWDPWWDF